MALNGTIGSTAIAAGSVTPGWVTVRTTDGRYTVTARLTEGAPETTGGRGGWQEQSRPRRPAVVEWVGTGLRQASVELFLDAWGSQGDVAAELAVIDGMAPPAPTSEPPQVLVTGAPGVPSAVPWVVNDVAFSDRLLLADGRTARVTVTLTLLEARLPSVTVVRADPAKRSVVRNGTTTQGKPRTYTVRRGDTLSGIAAKLLGSSSKWTTLAKLNGIRTPNALKVGQVLKLS